MRCANPNPSPSAFARLALRGDEVGAQLAHVEEVEVLRLVRKKLVGRNK